MKILQKIFILLGSIVLAGLLIACGNPGTGSPALAASDVLATLAAYSLGFNFAFEAIDLNDKNKDATPNNKFSIAYNKVPGVEISGTVVGESTKTASAKVVFTNLKLKDLTLFKNAELTGTLNFTIVKDTATDPTSETISLKSNTMRFTNGFAETIKMDIVMNKIGETTRLNGDVVVDGDTFQFGTIVSYFRPMTAAESILNETFLDIINGIDTSIPADGLFTGHSIEGERGGTITISGSKFTYSNGYKDLTIYPGKLQKFELQQPFGTTADGAFAMNYLKTGTHATLTTDFTIVLSIDSTTSSIAGSDITVNLETSPKLKATGYNGSITINGLAFPLAALADAIRVSDY